jgi:dTDP-4-dehydrorhamnose reductase
MRVLVTGVKGQLGYDVVKRLKSLNIDCLGVDIDDFDLSDAISVNHYIKEYMPTVVVHCAAYTAVEKAEENFELCYSVNVLGTRNIAEACKEISARMVYISTDYVFDGKGEKFFETNDIASPQNQYGKTKYEGELEVTNILEQYFIIRISWAFGINGNNFIKTMLKLGKERQELNVISDQFGSPTYTYDLALLIADMIKTDKYGIYHATNEGICSWYEFACEIFKLSNINVKVNPVTSDEYPTKVKRPHNSRLSKSSLDEAGFERLPDWKDSLARYILELKY